MIDHLRSQKANRSRIRQIVYSDDGRPLFHPCARADCERCCGSGLMALPFMPDAFALCPECVPTDHVVGRDHGAPVG